MKSKSYKKEMALKTAAISYIVGMLGCLILFVFQLEFLGKTLVILSGIVGGVSLILYTLFFLIKDNE